MSDALPLKLNRVGLSGPEKMFWDEIDGMGITIDAFIARTSRDWIKDTYTFRMTKPDGEVIIDRMDWDVNTFSRILKLAKGE